MNSVERVTEYLEIEQEPPFIIEDKRPPSGWPFSGEIEFRNVVLQYDKSSAPVLQDISIHIKGGETVGIVGRTGAGKRYAFSYLIA